MYFIKRNFIGVVIQIKMYWISGTTWSSLSSLTLKPNSSLYGLLWEISPVINKIGLGEILLIWVVMGRLE